MSADVTCLMCFFLVSDSSDIVDCKLKLILGLIWTLILHYSISMPMWDGEEAPSKGSGPTPKQRFTFFFSPSLLCLGIIDENFLYIQVDGMDPEQDPQLPHNQFY